MAELQWGVVVGLAGAQYQCTGQVFSVAPSKKLLMRSSSSRLRSWLTSCERVSYRSLTRQWVRSLLSCRRVASRLSQSTTRKRSAMANAATTTTSMRHGNSVCMSVKSKPNSFLRSRPTLWSLLLTKISGRALLRPKVWKQSNPNLSTVIPVKAGEAGWDVVAALTEAVVQCVDEEL